ncbi:ABC-type transport auxiliary lipoprotein family protein [Brevundimonas fluminis]|uniref:ABC-type transport auxiliary lipoprotein family protein n=1 Tax=Brevundimonas fluminis TaxID=2487274 RepID=UPI001F49FA5C|nr:ABC-type transport auxiliary lipoprotein family protein [Brevundimonas fluminis]
MIRKLSIAAVAASLSACALLSTPDPVQMYRFGQAMEAPRSGEAAGAVDVAVRRVTFPESAEGERILTITGTEAAYLKGARWVEPADRLFAAALEGAVANRGGRIRLIGARDLAQGDVALDVDATTFETRYAAPGATPVVVMTVRARLVGLPDREIEAERTFTVQTPATENRVGPIVAAYDAGSRDLAEQIAGWIESTARP